MAAIHRPTIHIIASNAPRNGKTLLARLVTDYLLLEGRDPFLIDTDAPEAPLRFHFPGRTALADLAKTKGELLAFDTMMASAGRDYVVDLTQRHVDAFFNAAEAIDFFTAARTQGFRISLFFVVDRTATSWRAADDLNANIRPDVFVAVRNDHVGSAWPENQPSIHLQALPRGLAIAISARGFSLSKFVLGDVQGLGEPDVETLNRFLTRALEGLSGVDLQVSFDRLKT